MSRTRAIAVIGLVVGLLLAGVSVVFFWRAAQLRDGGGQAGGTEWLTKFPPPARATSSFKNASNEVAFVGSKTCAECHETQHASYLQTAHSKALSELQPKQEPADAEFIHKLSNRRYRVYRKEGEFRHEEALLDRNGRKLAALDYAMEYLVGSGNHSRSYLAKIDGFLVESPVTWYVSRKKWSVSPGYDHPVHWSFERAADVGCLFCHLGWAEAEKNTLHKLKIHEQAIGCERCHGPGELHIKKHQGAGAAAAEESDATIVHPGRMDRRMQEDICAQCHLRGDATVLVRGRRLTDYRPGLPLADTRIDYRLQSNDTPMKVVGHVEQMRLSKCYQQTETFTCTTCHDPHSTQTPAEKLSFYRSKCLECHDSDKCGVPLAERKKQSANDNCLQCHMPQTPTDIPHIAFTHHRVGIHKAITVPEQPPADAVLVPYGDLSGLTEVERDRNLGLAYLEFSDSQSTPQLAERFRGRAEQLLAKVVDAGLRDGETLAALARIRMNDPRTNPVQILKWAEEALQDKDLGVRARINALVVSGDQMMRMRDVQGASRRFLQLTDIRRNSEDHVLLSICNLESGDLPTAIKHAEDALAINPFRPDIYERLAEIYRRFGDGYKARAYMEKARSIAAQTVAQ